MKGHRGTGEANTYVTEHPSVPSGSQTLDLLQGATSAVDKVHERRRERKDRCRK